MAQMRIDGLDELGLSLEQISQLPSSVKAEMLTAEADVAVKYQKRSIQEKGLSPNGKLLSSIKAQLRKDKNGETYAEVAPTGTHHINPGGTRVRNAELGFIREYGAKGKNISASQWMRTANEKAGKPIEEAALEVYDGFLKKNDL